MTRTTKRDLAYNTLLCFSIGLVACGGFIVGRIDTTDHAGVLIDREDVNHGPHYGHCTVLEIEGEHLRICPADIRDYQ